MQAGKSAGMIAIAAIVALAGCSGPENPRLMNVRSTGEGPDEFAVLPQKPLEMPENLAALPPPTPGTPNRTDIRPEADAIAALGGNPETLTRGGTIPASDGGLVNYAARYGVTPGIRQTLAAEDLEYRRNNDGRLLERWFNVNVYFRAYEPLSLDQYAELARWRAVGVRTVSAPPPQEGEMPEGFVEELRVQTEQESRR